MTISGFLSMYVDGVLAFTARAPLPGVFGFLVNALLIIVPLACLFAVAVSPVIAALVALTHKR